MEGFVKLHRKVVTSTVWNDPDLFRLWVYCLLKASHKERKVVVGRQEIFLHAGEFVTGRYSLFEDFNRGVAPKKKLKEITLWRLLKLLEKLGNLNIKSTNKYSVISVINWSAYQEVLTTNEHQMNNKCTTNEQQMNTNKNVKNVKNVKNDKNDKEIEKDSCRKYIFDDTHFRLATRFYQNILANNPDHKKPNLESWSNTIRLMMQQDKRTIEQIEYLVDWVQKDDFEMKNVLSPDKLRKRFDQLAMKVKAQVKRSHQETRKPKAFQSLEDWAGE